MSGTFPRLLKISLLLILGGLSPSLCGQNILYVFLVMLYGIFYIDSYGYVWMNMAGWCLVSKERSGLESEDMQTLD